MLHSRAVVAGGRWVVHPLITVSAAAMEEATRRLTALLAKADNLAVDISHQPAARLIHGRSRTRRPLILTLGAIFCALSWILQFHKPQNLLPTLRHYERVSNAIHHLLVLLLS